MSKKLGFERFDACTDLKYEKKSCPKIMKFRYFGEKLTELCV